MLQHKIQRNLWLNYRSRKKLFVKECTHGKGVFAAENIHAGEEILQFGGPVMDAGQLPEPYNSTNDYYLQIGERTFLGPSGQADDYVNHSCTPNSGIISDSGLISLIAIDFISANEQIFFDYSTTMYKFWFEMKCACGSENCRHKVKNFVDLSEQMQQKYIKFGIVPGYIVENLAPKKYHPFDYIDFISKNPGADVARRDYVTGDF